MRTPEGHEKSIFTTSKRQGAKNSYGGDPTNLQAEPKILTKLLEQQIYQSKQKILKNNCVSYLKSEKEPKIRIGATRQNLQAQPKMLTKMVGTSNQPIRTKIVPKKSMFSALSVKEPKYRMEATRRNLQAQPNILKKL
jgi:hypothetical protein